MKLMKYALWAPFTLKLIVCISAIILNLDLERTLVFIYLKMLHIFIL